MSPGGGGEDGREGGTSNPEDVVDILHSGMKGGGGMLTGGGGGTAITGGQVLSTMEGTTEAVLERQVPSPGETADSTASTNCRWFELKVNGRMAPKLATVRVESRVIAGEAGTDTATGDVGTD
jgi:hypothetical protein